MTNTLVETLIGAIVIGVAAVFLVFAYSSAGMTRANGYELWAIFNRVDGITTGTDVRIAGIKIGTVTGMSLDSERYLARVRLNVQNSVKLPDDSSIKVASESLLGGTYLAIEPGGSETYLQAGDEIDYTQGTVDLMSLISKAIFSVTSRGSSDKSSDKGEAPAPSNSE